MKLSRRTLLAAAGATPLAAPVLRASASNAAALPDKTSFARSDGAYLDSGSQHPLSIGARAAMDAYLAKRMLKPDAADYELDEDGPIRKFAELVNADPNEVTYVQSTTAGEQMILKALDIPDGGGRIVVDTLHFFGSLPLYEEMGRQGMDIAWVRDRDGRISMSDMKAAISKGAKLVALSLVSTINGFEHDLKAVCDIAHAHGALVYADIIHAAGCVPVDLHGSGVDFAACASYKWLMGEFGLGFLYVRRDRQHHLKRVNYGYYGMNKFAPHIYPYDPPGDSIADYGFSDNATGLFALGTRSHNVIAILNHSLDYIQAIGVENIQAYVQTMIARLKEELPQRGYKVTTPPETRTPIVNCPLEDARTKLAPIMKKAKIRITLSRNRFRITPSVFNDMSDIDRLMAALPRAS
ncbi:MAG: aminotransferase class V-fold PLP-dependent enzyme [Alphaproteobacteria bacterium]|nr:aminotransferase class V-fold PLP-dependent enzyme [Alphaproteobacteria bacterium]